MKKMLVQSYLESLKRLFEGKFLMNYDDDLKNGKNN